MVVATVGLGLLAAGLAIVAGAVAFLTSWFGLAVVGIAALIFIFKKAGGDFQVVTDGLKYLWEGFKSFLTLLKIGFLKVINTISFGKVGGEALAEAEVDLANQAVEREKLATAMSARMDANVAKREAEEKDGDKKEGGMLDGIKSLFNIDHKNRAGAHIEQKNAQVSAFKGIPGAVGGGMASGMPGLKEGVKEGVKEGTAKPTDFNAGPEALLKQFAQKEGSPLAEAQSVNPAAPKSQAALGPAAKDQTLKDLEKQQQDKTAAEKKKAEEEAAKKKAEDEAKEKEKNKDPKTQETPATLLAELNTKMATLLQYTFTVAHNTNETVTATRSLNGNIMKR
jgi:hypothetical protein